MVRSASPDVTLTLTDADARAVLAGELDLAVAFMQGRMKVAGAMAPLLDLLALAGTEAARACRAGSPPARTASAVIGCDCVVVDRAHSRHGPAPPASGLLSGALP